MTCHPLHNILFKRNGSTPYFLLKNAQLQTLTKIKFIVVPQNFEVTSCFLEVTLK